MKRTIGGTFLVLMGAYFIVTFQGWGFWLIARIGPDRALGAANVRHEPDGSVLMTNPTAMLIWSLPFLVSGIVLLTVGVKVLRRGCPAA